MPAPGTPALRAIRETLIHAVSLDPAIRDDDLRVLVQALLHMGDDLRATLEWSSWDIGQGDLREAMRRLRDCGLIRVHEETDADQIRGWTVWIAPEFLELDERARPSRGSRDLAQAAGLDLVDEPAHVPCAG